MKRRFRREQLNIKSGAGNGYMSSGRHGCKLGKKGFSLPELFIVVALMGILAVITMTGIIVFAQDLKLMEMDGTAKQIFVAAQNHLTRMEASGLLSEYDEAAARPGAEGELAKAALGNAMDKAEDYPADYPVSEGKSHAESWVAEVVNNPDGHAFYRVGHRSSPALNADNNLESSILKDMLPFGAIDDTVRSGGSYYIEYDLKTAQVYAVFYTDSADGLTELEVKQLSHSGRSDDNTGMEARKSLLTTTDGGRKTVGYYGGAAAQNLETVKLLEPKIIVENGEKLQIKIQDFNYFVGDGFGNNIESRLEVTVTGVDSGKSKTFNMAIGNTPNSDGFYPYSTEANNTWLWKAEKYDVLEKKYMEYTMTLDDISKAGSTNASGVYEGTHFADIFPEMIPGENIRIEAKLTSNNVLCGAVTAQAMTNSIFADASHITAGEGEMLNDTGKLAVKVSAVRHLENLNNAVSNINTNTALISTKGSVVETVDVVGDIYWKFIAEDSEGKESYVTKTTGNVYSSNTNSNKLLSNGSFYPIENKTIKKFSGNRFGISNFVINGNTGIDAVGLFSKLGVAGQETIEIIDVTLKNFNVKGNGCTYAGALVGQIDSSCKSAKISGVLVMRGTSSDIESSSVTGAKNSGGMIGYSYVTGAGSNGLEVNNCTVAGVKVEGTNNAGGLIGRLGGARAEIKNSYTSGTTKKGVYPISGGVYDVKASGTASADIGEEYGNAGGLIGFVYSGSQKDHKIINCFSTCSTAGAFTAGGIVGSDMNSTSTYTNCYTAAPVAKIEVSDVPESVSGKKSFGAFAGKLDSGVTIKGCEYNMNFYSSDDNMKATGQGDNAKIAGKTTSDLSLLDKDKVSAKFTFTYDDAFDVSARYPYRPVNATGYIVEPPADGSPAIITGVYYGDWEEPEDAGIPIKPDDPETPIIENIEIKIKNGYVYAYREKVGGKWYWYILTAENGVEGPPIDCLSHTNGVEVEDWQYGFIFDKDNKNSPFKGNGADYEAGVEVSIKKSPSAKEETYYFCKYKDTSFYDSEGFAVSPGLKFKGKNYKIVFNKNFAAAMTLVQFDGKMSNGQVIQKARNDILGQGDKAYHVRCQKQLNNIMTNGTYFPTKEYVQDCGFNVSKDYLPLPIETGTFSGKYDATYQDTELRYNIKYNGGDPDKLFNNVTGTVIAQINDNTVNQP